MTRENKIFINVVTDIPANGMEEWYVKDLIELSLKQIEQQQTKFSPEDIIAYMQSFKRDGKIVDLIYRVGETLSIKMNNGYSLVFDVNKDTGYIPKAYLFSPVDGNGISE